MLENLQPFNVFGYMHLLPNSLSCSYWVLGEASNITQMIQEVELSEQVKEIRWQDSKIGIRFAVQANLAYQLQDLKIYARVLDCPSGMSVEMATAVIADEKIVKAVAASLENFVLNLGIEFIRPDQVRYKILSSAYDVLRAN